MRSKAFGLGKLFYMKRLLLILVSVGVVGGGLWIWQSSFVQDHVQSRWSPEAGTGFREVKEVTAKSYMVATANVHASQAARDIIEQGGNAVDATIAAQLMLTLVEPQSSGIGGGAFLLFWDEASKTLKSFDGRETAPRAVKETLFLKEDGSRLGFGEAVRSGRSIGVPGVIDMMENLHKQHGKLAWAKLFAPAIEKARNGFKVSHRLNALLVRKKASFFNEAAQKLFFDDQQQALPEGTLLKNPALADTLQTIAEQGAQGFYQGPLAQAIVETTQKAPAVPSAMTVDDLKDYKALERPPVCGGYHTWKVCGMGPPSSGGTTVAMILGVAEKFSLGSAPNVEALHIIAEAEKLSYADRNHYMADADFIPQPTGFLDRAYLENRAKLIQPGSAMKKALPGNPAMSKRALHGQDGTVELGGTSHISIVDRQGNVVSMTSSIEGAFGSGQMVNGFLLNNQLTDFSFKPKDKEGKPIANRVQPLKRPRSSMSPTIVFDHEGNPKIVVGSPGGSRIILFVTKALIAHFDWGMGPQEAIGLFNFGSRGWGFELENRPEALGFAAKLEALGHQVRKGIMTSGAQMIVIEKDHLKGGADPRREGVVLGD